MAQSDTRAADTTKSLVINSIKSPLDLTIQHKPVPQAHPGSAVVEILSATIGPQSAFLLSVPIPGFEFPVPSTPGHSAIGRVQSVGPDAASLCPGQLVLVDCFVTSRDDPAAEMLLGLMDGGTPASQRLTRNAWRDGCWTSHAVVPLENVAPLDERALTSDEHGLGYGAHELSYLSRLAVAYGAVAAADLKAGETVLIGPATGWYGGAAVEVAAARGARVLAFGRNAEALVKLKGVVPRVETLVLSGDAEKDAQAMGAWGPPDAFIDFSPTQNMEPAHIGAAVRALRKRGRVVLMGGSAGEVKLPYFTLVQKSIQLSGKWMYTRSELRELIKMVETGVLKIGKDVGHEVAGTFGLEQWEEALQLAATKTAWGQQVLFEP